MAGNEMSIDWTIVRSGNEWVLRRDGRTDGGGDAPRPVTDIFRHLGELSSSVEVTDLRDVFICHTRTAQNERCPISGVAVRANGMTHPPSMNGRPAPATRGEWTAAISLNGTRAVVHGGVLELVAPTIDRVLAAHYSEKEPSGTWDESRRQRQLAQYFLGQAFNMHPPTAALSGWLATRATEALMIARELERETVGA